MNGLLVKAQLQSWSRMCRTPIILCFVFTGIFLIIGFHFFRSFYYGLPALNPISYTGYSTSTTTEESYLVRAYLDVVRDTVCGLSLRTREQSVEGDVSRLHPLNIEMRRQGMDWPLIGITMVGQNRLNNIEWALRKVITEKVPGDFMECGVWRGGSSVYARAVFKALNVQDRNVYLADSFEGLPKARTSNDDDSWSKQEYLKVSLEEVQTNFAAFNLLDDRVHFCKGFFIDSLPKCNVSRLAVLRMDGDMYESTMDQLFNLYEKLQVGGVIIVDDYTIPACNKAVHNFRQWHNITDKIVRLDSGNPVHYWIKLTQVKVKMEKYAPLLVRKTPAAK